MTMLFIQLIFIVRDNLASRLATGSVSALTYGWMFFQLPETLIGTAIGTAMLPSLATLAAKEDWQEFARTVDRAVKTLIVLTLPVAFILSIGLGSLISAAFDFNAAQTDLIMWVTRGYLLGLAGQSVLEVAVRSYYARKDAITPLIAAAINLIVYAGFALVLSNLFGAVGISLSDSLAFTSEAILLLWLFRKRINQPGNFLQTIPRGLIGGVVGAGVTAACIFLFSDRIGELAASIVALAIGGLSTLPIMWKELRQLTRL
jgi:putative peptidoglycan lipid II flippase